MQAEGRGVESQKQEKGQCRGGYREGDQVFLRSQTEMEEGGFLTSGSAESSVGVLSARIAARPSMKTFCGWIKAKSPMASISAWKRLVSSIIEGVAIALPTVEKPMGVRPVLSGTAPVMTSLGGSKLIKSEVSAS